MKTDPEMSVYPDGAGYRCSFTCPRDPDRMCGVAIFPATMSNGASWQWNGDHDAPTLTPSINCNSSVGCGWHGWLTDGTMVGQ